LIELYLEGSGFGIEYILLLSFDFVEKSFIQMLFLSFKGLIELFAHFIFLLRHL
jgi:hypothetical protein